MNDKKLMTTEEFEKIINKSHYSKPVTVRRIIQYINDLFPILKCVNPKTKLITLNAEVGEVNIHEYNTYIVLKDPSGTLKGIVCSDLYGIKELKRGLQIEVIGKVKYHLSSNAPSFVIDAFKIIGKGKIHEEWLEKREQVIALREKKKTKKIPKNLKKVFIVTGEQTAALGDFTKIMLQRNPEQQYSLYHVACSGKNAPLEIIGAIEIINNSNFYNNDIAIALIRGGGSWESLDAYNNLKLCEAIINSNIPIITGVGHEKDKTLVDFAADLRASTPSNCAELMIITKEIKIEDENGNRIYLKKDIDRLQNRVWYVTLLDGTKYKIRFL